MPFHRSFLYHSRRLASDPRWGEVYRHGWHLHTRQLAQEQAEATHCSTSESHEPQVIRLFRDRSSHG